MRKTGKSMKVSGLEIMERNNWKKFPWLTKDATEATKKAVIENFRDYIFMMQENILKKRKFRIVLDNETIVGENIRGPLLLKGENIKIDHCKIRGDIFLDGRKISITDCKVYNKSKWKLPFILNTPDSAYIYICHNEFTHED